MSGCAHANEPCGHRGHSGLPFGSVKRLSGFIAASNSVAASEGRGGTTRRGRSRGGEGGSGAGRVKMALMRRSLGKREAGRVRRPEQE